MLFLPSFHNQHQELMTSTREKKGPHVPSMSSSMRNELRGMVAVFCYSQVMRAGEMSKKEQELMLSKLFHGDKSTQIISHSSMLAEGEGIFAGAFNDVPDKPNEKHIKTLLNPTDEAVVLGTNLNVQVLERAVFTRPDLITGRQLLCVAQKQLRNITKAIPIMEKHLDTNTGKAKRSGENIQSVANHILDAMFLLLQGCEDSTGADSEEDDDESLKSDTNPVSPSGNPGSRPAGFFFPGYMSLMLFRPFEQNILANQYLDFFITKDPPAVVKKEFSRSAQRKRQAAKQNMVREADPQRGTTNAVLIEQKKLSLKEATIELQAHSFKEKLKEQRD